MTGKVQSYLKFLKSGEYKKRRRDEPFHSLDPVMEVNTFASDAAKFCTMLENEAPNIYPDDIFGFHRTVIKAPFCWYTRPNNIVPDYGFVMSRGLSAILADLQSRPACGFYDALIAETKSVLAFCERYRKYAEENGFDELAGALSRVPAEPPASYYEALVFLTVCYFTIRCNGNGHITFGRFDQYMRPYFDADVKRGVSEEELLELTELFFISLNFDTDLYLGVQLGDNGQSMVLGGYGPDGEDQYSKLSELCMTASRELKIIDPKINLRVNKTTPLSRYEFATELTRCGLGFPQYCNDDIVVPGLIKAGYAPEDAYDYAVAACWEFITSGKGNDIVNIRNLNLPLAISELLQAGADFKDFDEFYAACLKRVGDMCLDSVASANKCEEEKSPWFSLFVRDCVERGLDAAEGGARYNNYGFLVSGLSTLADSIAAVKQLVFEDRVCDLATLRAALDADFAGYEELRNKMLQCPKMGNNDDRADSIGGDILKTMAEAVKGARTPFGGIYRIGTGSAQGYIQNSVKCPATPDGRHAFTPYASSFTPSPVAKTKGPLSVIQSFTKFDLSGTINGGPLTMEIHDTVFRNDDGVRKTAMLVKSYIDRGGHQLQLNAVNRDVLLDAQKHPGNYPNLIVRVWGWSGYFNELDVAYQNQIISRTEYGI